MQRRPPDVDRQHPIGQQMSFGALEELPGREIKGDVGLAVGIDEDHVIAAGLGRHPVAPVGHGDVQVGLGHVEVAPADVDDLGVELDPVDWNRPVNCRELPSHRPGGQPDQRDAPRDSAGPEVGCQQDVVPVAVRVQAGGIVDRVDGRALIE